MSNNKEYLNNKLATILPKSNQFAVEMKLQIILKLQKDDSYKMVEEDYYDICQYCYDILQILENLVAGECFIKGILCYEIAKAKINLAEIKSSKIDNVRIIEHLQ